MLTDELQRLRVAVERVEREVEGCAFPYVREAAEAVERAVVEDVVTKHGGTAPSMESAAEALRLMLGASGSGALPMPLQDVIDAWFEAEARRRDDLIGAAPTAQIEEASAEDRWRSKAQAIHAECAQASTEDLLRILAEDLEALGPAPVFRHTITDERGIVRSVQNVLGTSIVPAGMADEPAFTIVDTTKPQYPVVSLGKAMRIGKPDEDDFFSRYR